MLSTVNATVAIGGERISGQVVRDQNVQAIQAVANVIKTSLGPTGLDKMLVDSIGDVTVTNDGATIVRLLDVQHPVAKMLVELAQQQDADVGDGTTTVVLLAAELLRRGNELVKTGRLHPTTVIAGYRLACREACRVVNETLSHRIDGLSRDALLAVARTSLSSKVVGPHGDFFAGLMVDAVLAIRTPEGRCSVESINVLKAIGRSLTDSQLVRGYALNCTVASQAMTKRVRGAKIACLDMNLQRARLPLGASVQLGARANDDPAAVEAIRKREIELASERVRKILAAGARVILTTKGIDDLCLKPIIEAGGMAVRRCKKEDLVRIAKACGATIVTSLAGLQADSGADGESFDAAWLGQAEEVVQERFGDDECILVNGTKAHAAASLVLRGANTVVLEEAERSIHDALCAVARVVESGSIVPGGGACETALSVYLETFAATIASREQMAVAEFGESLLSLPKQLAVNAGLDSTELVARLRATHYAALAPCGPETDELEMQQRAEYKNFGLDLTARGRVRDSIRAGVVEPALGKVKALRAATEAAIAILRIDDFMSIAPEKKGRDDDECH